MHYKLGNCIVRNRFTKGFQRLTLDTRMPVWIQGGLFNSMDFRRMHP